MCICNSSIWDIEAGGFLPSKRPALGCIVSLRPAWATPEDPVSEKEAFLSQPDLYFSNSSELGYVLKYVF